MFNCITSRPSSGTRSHPSWCHTNINKKPLFWRTSQCKPRDNRWLQKHIWGGHENNTVILVSLIDMASVYYQPNCCQWKAGSFRSVLKNHKAFALLMFRESLFCMEGAMKWLDVSTVTFTWWHSPRTNWWWKENVFSSKHRTWGTCDCWHHRVGSQRDSLRTKSTKCWKIYEMQQITHNWFWNGGHQENLQCFTW